MVSVLVGRAALTGGLAAMASVALASTSGIALPETNLVDSSVAPSPIAAGRAVLVRLRGPADPHSAAFRAVRDRLASIVGHRGSWSMSPALMTAPADVELAETLGLDRWARVETDDRAMLDLVRGELGTMLEVEAIEDDSIGETHGRICQPPDPLVADQWWANNSGQSVQGVAGTPRADARVAEAWCLATGSSSVVVAILDTGVSLSHPDLQTNVLPGYNFFNNNTNTDDGQSLSHGTFCAGIVLARAFNEIGMAGVAPSCSLLPVKVLSGSFGSETSTANGLIFAADRGAKVVNMSLGFSQGSAFFRDAVLYAKGRDVFMVASAGNSPTGSVPYPAKWTAVMAVGATDNRDRAAAFQTTGSEIEICAPGVNILTTTDTWTVPNGYSLQSGTSMAAPVVAGVAALVRSVRPTLNSEQVREVLVSSAKDLGPPGWDSVHGWGRVDAVRAVLDAVMYGRYDTPDFNQDGIVELVDLLEYITLWQAGLTDHNRDGVVDMLDLFAFVSSWQR